MGNTEKRAIKLLSVFKPKFLTILAVIVFLFNILSTKVLPSDIFLASASSINTSELVNLANTERANRGLNTLTVDSRLVSAAYAKGQDMLAKDYWDHFGPNGESPWDFILSSGYNYVFAGENLAKDFTQASAIHSAWMASPTHKSNIINSNFQNVGIAAVTGEFQGEETTIVVQMFGSLESTQSTPVVSGDVSDALPETGNEKKTLSTPQIDEPQDGDILDSGIFDIKGTAYEGSSVKLYDNEEEMTDCTVDSQSFVYTVKKALKDGDHLLQAQAFDSSGNFSNRSSSVNIQVDTIDPLIVKESVTIDYVELSGEKTNISLSVEVQDNPIRVVGYYDNQNIMFTYDEQVWTAVFAKGETFQELRIKAADAAGNEVEETFSSEEFQSLVDKAFPQDRDEKPTVSGFWQKIWGRIFTRSLRGQINFVIAFAMVILLIMQQIILARTGLTKSNSMSILHIPVFAVLIFVSLLGGGGEIL
jgi:hypothetical protein